MSKLGFKKTAIILGIAVALLGSRTSWAGTYTYPVTAMGVTHCQGGGPAGWKVISWIKFGGFYWDIGWADINSGVLFPAASENLSNIAQASLSTGQNVTGGCVSGTGMSNCASISWCGDGRTYWELDNLQLGN